MKKKIFEKKNFRKNFLSVKKFFLGKFLKKFSKKWSNFGFNLLTLRIGPFRNFEKNFFFRKIQNFAKFQKIFENCLSLGQIFSQKTTSRQKSDATLGKGNFLQIPNIESDFPQHLRFSRYRAIFGHHFGRFRRKSDIYG